MAKTILKYKFILIVICFNQKNQYINYNHILLDLKWLDLNKLLPAII